MLNNVILMGRMTADAELKSTPNGKYVTSFSIAVERDYSQNGERQTDFINLVAWNKTAEFITNYFGKGDMIAVTGSIQTRNYEDKNGNKRTATEVIVDKASFCGSKTERREEPKATEFEPLADDDLDLPF
jgi:single-strand DNA-binding protein